MQRRGIRRLVIVLVVMAMVAAACGGEDEDVINFEADFAASCVVDKGHVLTRAGAHDLTGYGLVQVDDLETFFADRYVGDDAVSVPTDVDIWSTSEDALDVVWSLRAQEEIDVWPIYMMGLEGHWSLEPGGESAQPQALGSASDLSDMWDAYLDPPAAVTGAPTVAIVDLGFNGATTDADSPEKIHGSFVESIVRFMAPASAVKLASLPQIDRGKHDVQAPFPDDNQPLTDEFAVASAIFQVAVNADYLNLSLGTYLCSMDDAPDEPIHLRGSIEPLSLEGFFDGTTATVIAAGGNDVLDPNVWGRQMPVFYPAGHQNVHGVGALNDANQTVQWDHEPGSSVHRSPNSVGPSWDVTAPGVDLVGAPFDQAGGQLMGIVWSGSSFAAAVLTGAMASGCFPNDAAVTANTGSVAPAFGLDPGSDIYPEFPGLLYLGSANNLGEDQFRGGCIS